MPPLTEPAAISLHALYLAERVLHRLVSEDRTLVIGGGSVGLLAALFLHSHGCKEILLCDTNPLLRETVFRTGCCEVFDPEIKPVNLNDSLELVVDAVGIEASRRMEIRAVRHGGVMMHIGLQQSTGDCDFRKIILAEITIIGTYTYTHTDLEVALKILHSGALGDLSWVEERPLSEGASAFSNLNDGCSVAPKIILNPKI